ncbi:MULTISPECIES: hypothetical protein [unclassified Bradyrhizobium]|uniref:hypothetical protein n=1 Tax=unclassified Bradyrhizobium TaxID=2631580 RepID=UPI002305805B|nr:MULTISPECIES: hypothetical protein [unclassified Bradyrhizobium]MDA9410792.1 hypothetical protein [Bradyrhizobium sp. CCBAU 45384]MDA9445110.1 hypothetical protein [Bradyrhizobium sp. CCBAU 51745]
MKAPLDVIGRANGSAVHEGEGWFGSFGRSRHDDQAEEGREAVELPGCGRQRLQQCGKAAVFVDILYLSKSRAGLALEKDV